MVIKTLYYQRNPEAYKIALQKKREEEQQIKNYIPDQTVNSQIQNKEEYEKNLIAYETAKKLYEKAQKGKNPYITSESPRVQRYFELIRRSESDRELIELEEQRQQTEIEQQKIDGIISQSMISTPIKEFKGEVFKTTPPPKITVFYEPELKEEPTHTYYFSQELPQNIYTLKDGEAIPGRFEKIKDFYLPYELLSPSDKKKFIIEKTYGDITRYYNDKNLTATERFQKITSGREQPFKTISGGYEFLSSEAARLVISREQYKDPLDYALIRKSAEQSFYTAPAIAGSILSIPALTFGSSVVIGSTSFENLFTKYGERKKEQFITNENQKSLTKNILWTGLNIGGVAVSLYGSTSAYKNYQIKALETVKPKVSVSKTFVTPDKEIYQSQISYREVTVPKFISFGKPTAKQTTLSTYKLEQLKSGDKIISGGRAVSTIELQNLFSTEPTKSTQYFTFSGDIFRTTGLRTTKIGSVTKQELIPEAYGGKIRVLPGEITKPGKLIEKQFGGYPVISKGQKTLLVSGEIEKTYRIQPFNIIAGRIKQDSLNINLGTEYIKTTRLFGITGKGGQVRLPQTIKPTTIKPIPTGTDKFFRTSEDIFLNYFKKPSVTAVYKFPLKDYSISKGGLIEKTKQRQILKQEDYFKEIQKDFIDQRPKQDQVSIQKTGYKEEFTEMELIKESRLNVTYPPVLISRTRFSPPPLIFAGIPFLPKGSRQKKAQRDITQRGFFYQPSATAVWFGIRGRQPKQKIFTGFELRPIPFRDTAQPKKRKFKIIRKKRKPSRYNSPNIFANKSLFKFNKRRRFL